MNIIRFLQTPAQPEVDLRRTYDAIVIGSGAAGGMAAHVMTSQGMKVLLLEAGKKLDIDTELKSMEWPFEHPRRGNMPPGHHALSFNECFEPTCRPGTATVVRRRTTPRHTEGCSLATRSCGRGCSISYPDVGERCSL